MSMSMPCLIGGQFGLGQGGRWHRQIERSEISSVCDKEGFGYNHRRRSKAKFGHVTYATTAFGDSIENEIHGGVNYVRDGSDGRKKMAVEELEYWLQNSIAEIVKNVSEAPLLVQIYTENGPKSSPSPSPSPSNTTKVVIEKATSETWPEIKQRWKNSCNVIPNGIILVEELDSRDKISSSQQEFEDKSCCFECWTSNTSDTRVWGVIVQGRGLNNVPSCYLLKTCQVQSCFGLSTHFCLAKVDCFGKSVDFHLSNLWLQR